MIADELPALAPLISEIRQFARPSRERTTLELLADVTLLARVAQASRTSMILTDAVLDEPGPTILWVNPAFERTTGYSADQVVGRNPRFLQGPGTDRRVLDDLRAMLERDEDFEGEAINYRADGTPFVMSWRITALRDAQGTPTHYLATQDDVTELRLRPLANRQAIINLQEALLPSIPDRIGNIHFGSVHRPTDGQLVGGDWIEAVASPEDDTVIAVVGDVTGHGARAVASMGQLRWAIRANVAAGLSLRQIVGSLRRLADDQDLYATVMLLACSPDGRLDYLCAGHPPAFVVGVDGSVRELGTTAPLIGIGVDVVDGVGTDRLEPGETLVAYTDGLVERRHLSIIDGLDSLRSLVAALHGAGLGPQAIAEQLVRRMVEPDPGEDDVAVLVLHRSADGADLRAEVVSVDDAG